MNQDRLTCAEELASRPYQIELQAYETLDGQTYFFGRVPEMPGCVSDGATEQEAKANVKSAMVDFIYFLLEDGLAVPEPRIFGRFTIINVSDTSDGSAYRRAKAYRSLSFGSSYNARDVTTSHKQRLVYVS